MNKTTSIIIPTYNEEETIVKTLQHVFDAIKYANLLAEVIIVDSSSNNLTKEAIKKYSILSKNECEIIAMPHKTFAGKARNLGVMKSKCPVIAFIDAGVYVEHDWLACLYKVLHENNADIVWGRSDHRVNNAWQRSYIRSFYRMNYTQRFIRSCLMRKDTFELVGGFIENVHAGEDLDFYRKVEKLKLNEKFASGQAWYSHYPENVEQIYKKWTAFTADNVVAKQAKRKLIFVIIQVLILIIAIYLLHYNLGVGVVSIFLITVLRSVLQWKAAKIPMQNYIEIPLTIFLIFVFDCARAVGLIKGYIRLIKEYPRK